MNFEGLGDAQAKVLRILNDVQCSGVLEPILNAIRRWTSSTSPTTTPPSRDALLDSGATHILRQPRDLSEWEGAREVHVQLAGDSSVKMKQTSDGTLLSGEELSQVIVPFGKCYFYVGLPASLDTRSV